MSLLIIPLWTAPDGVLTSRSLGPADTHAEAQRLVHEGFAMARRERGRGVRVSVMDDVTARVVVRVRPKGGA